MAKDKVYITLEVGDKGSKVVKSFDKNTEQAFNKMKANAKASTASMGSSLQKLKSHWMAVTAATAGTIIAVGKVLKKFATWEVALTDMKKVTSESLASIKQKIMGIHPAIGTSIELVKGYYQVISAGVKHPVKSLSLLVTASKAAKAAHVAQSEVIKGLTKIMAGYEGEIKNVSEAADLLFAIEKEGQTTVAELIPLIGGLAKISHDLGISQDEMGASLALVTQTAGSTAEAATQYQGVLMALLKPTDAMKNMIKAMGFESAEAAIKQLGLAETLRRLKGATGGSAEKMAEMFGRVEGLKGMSALAANEFDHLTGKVEAMKKKTGSAADAWDDYKNTSTSAWEALKGSIEKVTIAVGKGLAPATKQWAGYLSEAAEYWTKLFAAKEIEQIWPESARVRVKIEKPEKIELPLLEDATPKMAYELGLINAELRVFQLQSEAAWAAYQKGIKEAITKQDEFMEGIYGERAAIMMLEQEIEKGLAQSFKSIGEQGKTTFDDLKNAVTGWASTFNAQLTDILWAADTTFRDILESFGRMLTQMVIQKKIVEPILGSEWFKTLGSAHGNVFDKGRVVPYGRGGIVTRPTVFPMAHGLGLMGEKGPEAVMPLARTRGGDLGIKGGIPDVTINMINQSGQPLQATKQGSRQESGKFIIDVVVKELQRGKTLRQMIRSTT